MRGRHTGACKIPTKTGAVMDILTVDHLTKTYGSGATATTALDDVSFSVRQGEFLAIVGSSGSGKSTLLHLMGGVDRPTSGTVLLNGANVYARTDNELAVFRRREVGLVYQFYNLIPVLNVVENMTLPVALDGRDINQERLRMLVEQAGLKGRETHLPSQAFGRPAATRGHRARAYERTRRGACRRTNGQS